MVERELANCPCCGSGPAQQPGRFTNASFSGVEIMDPTNAPYVWCGTCCLQTCTYDSVAEAIAAWNTRPPTDEALRIAVRALGYIAGYYAPPHRICEIANEALAKIKELGK